MTIDRDALRSAVGSVLVNASNFPPAVQFRMLGQDMTPLIDKVAAVLDAILPEVQHDAWAQGYEARVRQVETEQRYDTSNPYRKVASE